MLVAEGESLRMAVLAYRFGVLPYVDTVSEIEEAEGVLPRLTLRLLLGQRPVIRSISGLIAKSEIRETNVGATAPKYQARGHPPAQCCRQRRL